MYISALRMFNVRSFQSAELNLHPGFNILLGNNGAGKTSVIEAVDYLSRGKSFRAANVAEIISRTHSSLAVSAVISGTSSADTHLAVKKLPGGTELSVNQEVVPKWSAITSFIPVISIHPESYLLVTGGPAERRRYLDWGLFHVEPDYKNIWSAYNRALKQRNSCLRAGDILQAKQWNDALANYGSQLNESRRVYVENLIPVITAFAENMGLPHRIDASYRMGWSADKPLIDVLEQELQSAKLPQTTRVGPHRADLELNWRDKRFSMSSSRGQQKAITIAMHLAQSSFIEQRFGKKSVYLVDELPAELDQSTCDLALRLLRELNNQVIITAVSDYYLKSHISSDANWFHVEPGQVNLMV